jgi:hypothetical protein
MRCGDSTALVHSNHGCAGRECAPTEAGKAGGMIDLRPQRVRVFGPVLLLVLRGDRRERAQRQLQLAALLDDLGETYNRKKRPKGCKIVIPLNPLYISPRR